MISLRKKKLIVWASHKSPEAGIKTYNIVIQKRSTFLERLRESLTINPLVPSVHSSCGAWKVVYWFCLCFGGFFFVFAKVYLFVLCTQKPQKDFHFYCITQKQQNKSGPVGLSPLCSGGHWCWLILKSAAIDSLGFTAAFCTHQLCGSLRETKTEENWIRMKMALKHSLSFVVSFTGLVPEQKIKRAPTQAAHEHGSWTVLRWLAKDARLSHESVAGRTWRARLSLLCQW